MMTPPVIHRIPCIALSVLALAVPIHGGREQAIASGLPLISITNWHGEGYGDLQIRGDKNDRVLVVGTRGFDDSYCAFVVKHERSVPKVGSLTLCRCDQILYNARSPKDSYSGPPPQPWQATDSKLFSVKDGWVDTTLEYIESEVCAPGPCCYENVTKTPDFPPGFVPNYRKSATTGTTLSTTTTTTSQESVDEQKQGLSTGIIVAIAVGGGVACLYMLWSWDLLLLPTSKFKPTKKRPTSAKTEKENA
ncbi:uncharacterized protein LOC129597528 isoform X2 [Paramacrobiotus metropolitanus]|uniref:uncharacterized protein LOC129597528 isoform X2 n=1 Tax=Paramacrobiotus metropolitanus TaxID=2943436 RepID=UPI002445B131|nr:uncharacterized protein LOC129597528 isoform X2 [Paramacrobiotus metropolitanus]